MKLRGVDMPARARAAELLADYLDGRISGGQLQEAWPRSQWDAALEGIAGVAFSHVGGGSLREEVRRDEREDLREVLSRCRLFLRSELPYPWGDIGARDCLNLAIVWSLLLLALVFVMFLVADRMGPAVACLGLMVLLLAGRQRINDSRARMRSLVSGDLRYWPFDSREDLFGAERQLAENGDKSN